MNRKKEDVKYRTQWRLSCETALTNRNRSMKANGGKQRAGEKRRSRERGKRRKGVLEGRAARQGTGKEEEEEGQKREQVLSPMPRVPRLSPKAERKVLSARSYLSLSVVAVASGHDQSEVGIPGYQSAPSAYIIVRSLGHCLSTVVNHILFPRLRFRFIYLSEKRIATVLVANSRALTRTRALAHARARVYEDGRERGHTCVGGHTCKIERHVFYSVCARTQTNTQREREKGEREEKRKRGREREGEQCGPSWLRLLTAERVRGKGDRNERLRFLLSTRVRPSSTTV